MTPGHAASFTNPSVVALSATLSINNGATSTTDPTVSITLTNVVGRPIQMRISVDTPITDATPIQAYAMTFTRTITNLTFCSHTVYVQLLDVVNNLTSEVLSARITVDNQIQAIVEVRNPYLPSNSVIFSELQQIGPYVNNGDPGYTRQGDAYVEVNGAPECSNLSSVTVTTATGSLLPYLIAGNFFANILPLPGHILVGSNPITLSVVDSVGNVQIYNRNIIYDPTPPTVVTTGTLEINFRSGSTILVDLGVSGEVITDSQYPGRGFWGVIIANSRTAVADPTNDTTLIWQTVQVNEMSSDFTLSKWSLLGSLPEGQQQTPGDYYVYMRFIDGAGNASNGYLMTKVNLSTIIRPITLLPSVQHP